MTGVMRAAVAERPGPPDVLAVREMPIPQPRDGWTLVQVMASGLKTALLTERGADDVLVDTGQEAFTGLAADYVLT